MGVKIIIERGCVCGGGWMEDCALTLGLMQCNGGENREWSNTFGAGLFRTRRNGSRRRHSSDTLGLVQDPEQCSIYCP